MRRFGALVRTAMIESLAEPLTAVLFLSGLALVHLAPVFHYHQFGEAGRLARECGFSVVLVFGLIFATSAALQAIGGELRRGTAAATLALAVPRALFFTAKVTGVLLTLMLFTGAVICATAISQGSSMIASFYLAEHGEGLQSWGPGVAAGFGGTILAFALAALTNRFGAMRFCVSASLLLALSQPLALIGLIIFGQNLPASFLGFGVLVEILFPAFVVFFWACAVFVAFAGALATTFKSSTSTALVLVALVSSFVHPLTFLFPDINRFWLVDRLAGGGQLAWATVVPELLSGCLLLTLWLIVGSLLLARREIP